LTGFTIWSTILWEEPLSKAKPYSISKWVVFEAYKRVKANKGAAGVDDESIADFGIACHLAATFRRRFVQWI
jgi:retron-type reverse transcriptase